MISKINGEAVTEFGEAIPENEIPPLDPRIDWRKKGEDAWSRLFGVMPHRKRWVFADDDRLEDNDFAETAAFSPDGIWFGPLREDGRLFFLNSAGERRQIRVPDNVNVRGMQATWSPSDRHVVLIGNRHTTGAQMIDAATGKSRLLPQVHGVPDFGSWEYRKCRWNPWSKDGQFLTFVHNEQICLCLPDGSNGQQLTSDPQRKAFPTFSRDNKRIAYVCWTTDPDNRSPDRRPRLGDTELWVVDIQTRQSTRVARAASGKIHSLDWLDERTIIFDRVEERGTLGYDSSLRLVRVGSDQ
jgi:hypothetical protein